MVDSRWGRPAQALAKFLMRPILFHDLKVTFIDVIGACHPSDWVTSVHKHPWYEFNYVSDGAVFTCMEDTEFLAEAGSFFLIPPGVRHSHRHYNHSGDDGFCVRWRLELVAESAQSSTEPLADTVISRLSRFQPRTFAYRADGLFDAINPTSSYFAMEAALMKWLLDICDTVMPVCMQSMAGSVAHGQKGVVEQVLIYLNEYSAMDFHVNELADSIGYSYRHLSRIFKDTTGSTIIEKLNSIRIAKAIELLESTDMPISVVCSTVGFQTETYFYTLFSQFTHMSPAQFRRAHWKK